MKVLVACEFSGRVRSRFAALGHNAWSCDFLPTEIPGNHFIGDVRPLLQEPWDLVIAFPPCTYLTNSGVRWLDNREARPGILTGPARWRACFEACGFFRLCLNANAPRVAVENPVPHGYALRWIGQNYSQITQPFLHGHPETKKTCLWLKGLPELKPTNCVDGRIPRVHHASPKPDRWKERSRTLPGLADAFADQWGNLDSRPALDHLATLVVNGA